MHFLKWSCNLIFKDTNNSFWVFKICLDLVICLASYIRLLWMSFILNLSDDVWCECLLSVQLQLPPLLLESSEITWNNKRGWSVPRHYYDDAPMFFGFYCSTSVHDTEHKSAVYVVHPTGKTCSIFIGSAVISSCHLTKTYYWQIRSDIYKHFYVSSHYTVKKISSLKAVEKQAFFRF